MPVRCCLINILEGIDILTTNYSLNRANLQVYLGRIHTKWLMNALAKEERKQSIAPLSRTAYVLYARAREVDGICKN